MDKICDNEGKHEEDISDALINRTAIAEGTLWSRRRSDSLASAPFQECQQHQPNDGKSVEFDWVHRLRFVKCEI